MTQSVEEARRHLVEVHAAASRQAAESAARIAEAQQALSEALARQSEGTDPK